jgi:hypothetical protein
MSRLSALWRRRAELIFDASLKFVRSSKAALIRSETLALQYCFNVIPERKLIYIEVPKAACTTIKRVLSRSHYGVELPNPLDYHHRKKSKLMSPADIGLSRFEKLIRDPETLTFTVVRNPYARLLSCYRDKFANLRLSDRNNFLIEHLLESSYAQRLSEFDFRQDRLSFESFLGYACETAKSTPNGHWSLASRIIPDPDILNVRIIKLEELNQRIQPILDRLEASNAVRKSLFKPTNKSIGQHIVWPQERLTQICEAYAADFSRFGYRTDVLPASAQMAGLPDKAKLSRCDAETGLGWASRPMQI